MTTLHTVNKSPHGSTALDDCLSRLGPGDAVLLIEDGALAARKSLAFAERLAKLVTAGLAVHALAADLAARGISPDQVAEGIRIVDYDGFVDLAAAHACCMCWN